jgi:hypothetical protein
VLVVGDVTARPAAMDGHSGAPVPVHPFFGNRRVRVNFGVLRRSINRASGLSLVDQVQERARDRASDQSG